MTLIPTLGMFTVSASSGLHRWKERATAATVSVEAARMEELMTARAVVRGESVQALALANAAEFGLSPTELTAVYGVDFSAGLAEARAEVDANRIVQTEPALREHVEAVLAERSAIDAGTLASTDARVALDAMTGAVNELWLEAWERLEATITAGSISGEVRQQVDVLRHSYDAFLAGGLRIGLAIDLATGVPEASARGLIESDARLTAALASFEHEMGDGGATAFRAFNDDAAVKRFELLIETMIVDALAMRPSPFATDRLAYGLAFIDTATWIDRSTRVVAAASADLSAVAESQAHDSSGGFWTVLGIAAVVFLVATVAVAFLSRSFTRPLDRIATVVQAVRDGDFDVPRVAPHGPRELSDTVIAVNDMAASIDASSHDAITGLLNRRAALDAVARDLTRAVRDEVRVMAIYLDVDGLKRINDTHGHQAGDRALALVAEALRQTCRDGDVVARLGGDEFLVSGMLRSDVAAIEGLADRIREAVGRSVLWFEDTPVTLACSVGVAVSELGSTDVEALIAEADTAMYLMKVAGRVPQA